MDMILGIDIGGMSVKGVIADKKGKILAENAVPTALNDGERLSRDIAGLATGMIRDGGFEKDDFAGIGIGCPGLIDGENGTVVFAGNLGLENFPLGDKVSEAAGMEVRLTNDANAAALGEAKFGAGRKFKDGILITLGTGVGGGIVVNGRLFEGGNSAGAEIGHAVIVKDGEQCTCGRKGCLEAYASATALIRQTRRAMEAHADSAMWQAYTPETVTGRTAFEYADADEVAKSVVDGYISYLACGIINLANVFRPQAVMLGGGISGQGEKLTAPLQKILDKEIFAGQAYAPVRVVTASLGNGAGALGAGALFLK